MNQNLFKNFNLFKFLSNIFILIIITSIFINYIHRNSIFSNITVYTQNGEVVKTDKNEHLYFKNNKNVKILYSGFLTGKDNYSAYFNRDCVVSESSEERKRVRWIWPYFYYQMFNQVDNLSKTAPYYTNILFFSFLLFLTYFFIFKAFPIPESYKFLFLFFIAFVFQNPLGEHQFSIVETFLMSLAFYASRFKKFKVFVLAVLLAQLNRESGFLLGFIWLVFNKDFKKTCLAIAIAGVAFGTVNYDIITCLINPKFYIPLEYQKGQFNLEDVGNTISIASMAKVILLNFIIPFGSIFYLIFTTSKRNNVILFLTTIYFIIFLVVLPWQHIAVRLMLLPILLSVIYFKNLESNN